MRVGIDILDAIRMENIAKNTAQLKQVFTETEIEYFTKSKNYLPRLAGMYCAKEAFLKALGIGVRNGINFLEIEVEHEESGRPIYKFSDNIKDILKSLKVFDVQLSISHTDNFATAICIMN